MLRLPGFFIMVPKGGPLGASVHSILLPLWDELHSESQNSEEGKVLYRKVQPIHEEEVRELENHLAPLHSN